MQNIHPHPVTPRSLDLGFWTLDSTRERGIAAVLAMMFLVIFGSLATAMAIVSQGNLRTADSYLKVQRAQAATESGMDFISYHLREAAKTVQTRKGVIEGDYAFKKWLEVGEILRARLAGDEHYATEGEVTFSPATGYFYAGPIRLGLGSPTFEIEITPHPLPAAADDPTFYQTARYSVDQQSDHPYARLQRHFAEQKFGKAWEKLTAPERASARAAWQPDPTLIRVKVTATAGKTPNEITRSVSMDFHINRRIDYAILAKSRIMIGQNVMVDGAIGSEFTEVGLKDGHPIQMKSDFRGLDPDGDLDDRLDQLLGTLSDNDTDGDNRIDVNNATETDGLPRPRDLDVSGDGYIDDYDFFLDRFGQDTDSDGIPEVSESSLANAGVDKNHRAQIVELIDTFGDPQRIGFNDGVLDEDDRYAKIRGEVRIKANKSEWESGAARYPYNAYQDYFEGPIDADHNQAPLTFDASTSDGASYGPGDFDVSAYAHETEGDLNTQAGVVNDPSLGSAQKIKAQDRPREAVPYGAEYPYDFYARDEFRNMVFDNVRIPEGANALFVNCRFKGVTYVVTEPENDDEKYNYAGMTQADGTEKYPNTTSQADGQEIEDTKTSSNNIRFHNCTFEGSVVAGGPDGEAPKQYTHTRNKLAFTGDTKFADVTDRKQTPDLTESERRMFERSRLMAPQFSVEIGTFEEPANSNETVNLTGTIVAGLIDMRGQVTIKGTLLTTFAPKTNQGPVVGPTSPQFNTTLGYFSSDEGDLEAEIPPEGMGVIQVQHDPTISMPDGIRGPIHIDALPKTYSEGGG